MQLSLLICDSLFNHYTRTLHQYKAILLSLVTFWSVSGRIPALICIVKNKITYLWLKTIQLLPVPKAGGDLELSVSYVRKKMAERHRRVVMNLVEYQWKRKGNSSLALTQSTGIFLQHWDIHMHNFRAAVLKACKENQVSTSSFFFFLYFLSPHCEITLFELSPHLLKEAIFPASP